MWNFSLNFSIIESESFCTADFKQKQNFIEIVPVAANRRSEILRLVECRHSWGRIDSFNFKFCRLFWENINISAEPNRIEFESVIENRLGFTLLSQQRVLTTAMKKFKFHQNWYLIVLMRCSQPCAETQMNSRRICEIYTKIQCWIQAANVFSWGKFKRYGWRNFIISSLFFSALCV